LKTKVIWALAAGCGLAAFESRVGAIPATQASLSANNQDYATVEPAASLGESNHWLGGGDAANLTSIDRATINGLPPLDMAGAHQTDATFMVVDVPQAGAADMDRDLPGRASAGSSLILIGLGGGVLICLAWKMADSPQSRQ
jgi:hypothetical protein